MNWLEQALLISTPMKRGVNDIRPASQGRSMKYPGSTGVLNKTTVECEVKAGKIIMLKVTPESRRKDVELGLCT